jgi:hypothetical protein
LSEFAGLSIQLVLDKFAQKKEQTKILSLNTKRADKDIEPQHTTSRQRYGDSTHNEQTKILRLSTQRADKDIETQHTASRQKIIRLNTQRADIDIEALDTMLWS